jgi:xanthine phosphoribosyltransferase
MQRLIDKIKEEAYVIDNRIVKVDHFINHMLDTELVFAIGEEFAKVFPKATKILTIEASGIAFAVSTAFHLKHVPIVFARKRESLITGTNVFSSTVVSFTKEETTQIIVDKEFLTKDDHVLIIDDFLATGSALKGLVDITKQSGATIAGIGIVIEKGFLNGRQPFVEQGINVHTLANIKEITNNHVYF